MASAQQLDGLKVEWESCERQDDQKRSVVKAYLPSTVRQLFAYIDDLSNKLSETESELQDKKDAIQKVRSDLKEQKEEVQTLIREKDRYAFALVIVDGDNMPFTNELVQQGLEGGKRAVSLLKEAAEAELKTSFPHLAPHMKVLIRVYANVEGLAATYKKLDITSEVTFVNFVRGFNIGHTLADFVDAGNGKECADAKINAMVTVHLEDVHCQQIFFGGSADAGYARLLEPIARDKATRQRITLLKGPPFVHELANIKDRFHVPTTSFEHIFRDERLPDIKRRVSFRITPPTTPSANYASTVAKPPPTTLPSSVPVSKGIIRNRQGQRIDPSSRFTQQELGPIIQRKLCNVFHLLGACPYLQKYGDCGHTHGAPLSKREQDILREIARQSPCKNRLECNDVDCILGHQCPRNCTSPYCRFDKSMHNVDVKIYTET
ncbi:uncharacterized protein F5Z01DRAFT_640630 [Emericellopsis atlantica]|uniref:C3H1-type domain-containing protein n=1 Tax=Emericellopsis atlantica TaxID=2614577 RepID=A0A9P8CK12_9HYPO|nr:uncharacterized protein F5Z01DRAFT_640630 [Emericellopsis atlantica]KAG9250049.1 hypothetical protein F5Z01DRAFT_640630 [Emericellopsis atlantica]